MQLTQVLAAARAWCSLWGTQQAYEEARREVSLSEELLRRVQQAAALGALTRADVADARSYAAEARLQSLSLEGEVFDGSIELAREVALEQPVRAAGVLPELPLPPGVEDTLASLERYPPVALRALQQQAEAARLVELRASKAPILQLGAVAALQPSPVEAANPGGGVAPPAQAFSVMGAAALTLPLFDRGQRERGAMVAAERRLRGEVQSETARARIELSLAHHEVGHSGEVLGLLRDQLVPAATEAAQLRETAFRAGEATVVEVLLSRRGAAAARGRFQRGMAAHVWARFKLNALLQSLRRDGTTEAAR